MPSQTCDTITLARWAAKAAYSYSIVPDEDRFGICYMAILDAVADGITGKAGLLRAANMALSAAARDEWKFRGYRRPDSKKGPGPDPRYCVFWVGSSCRRESFTEKIIEQIAIRQVMDAMPHRSAAILRQQAAGLSENTPGYRNKLANARRIAKRLWYDWESPSTLRVRREAHNRLSLRGPFEASAGESFATSCASHDRCHPPIMHVSSYSGR